MDNNMDNNMNNLCDLCSHKYPNEMILGKQYCDFNQCYDCLFSMNYNNKDIINGSMGINLKDYLEKSIKCHALINEIPCPRLTDVGGCYVCMKLLDIPFDLHMSDNKNNNHLNDKNKSENESKPNKINTSDNYKSHLIDINNQFMFSDDDFILSL